MNQSKKKYLYLFKWLIKRFGFIKRILFEFVDSLIYHRKSQFLLHSWHGHRTPFQMILFYNLFGRIIFATKEFIALLTNGKLVQKRIQLEGYEEIKLSHDTGDYNYLWPLSPLENHNKSALSLELKNKIKESLTLAYRLENNSFEKTEEWDRVSDVFKTLFFDENREIDERVLVNFRSTNKRCEEVFGDHFFYVDKTIGYTKSYLKAIDLVLDYHRFAKVINKELLVSVTESDVGGSSSVYYRGQALSEKLLFHTMIVNDVINHIRFDADKRNVVVDIGSGYGGLDRLLSYYIPNACFVLVDLPETLLLTSYFIAQNFPNKKIALLRDIIDDLDNFDQLVLEYDFIIVPPYVVEKISNESVDLVLNSASLGFMDKDYVHYYMEYIARMLKPLGHFYSLNKEYSNHLGMGNYEWDFRAKYLTKLMAYNNRFSYMQWLGQKII
jgi:putative sugar O-methyltransferase